MGALFFKVLEMSLMGSVVILITILARFFLRKRSKTFIMILWAVVALRLIVPFGFESAFSIFNYVPLPTQGMPAAVEVSEAVLPDSEPAVIQAPVNDPADYAEAPVYNEAPAYNEVPVNAEAPARSANEVSTGNKAEAKNLPDIRSVVAIIWFTGMVVFTTYICVRYFDLKDKLKNAKKIAKNVYECDNVKSPFVFGFIVPKMYLPDTLDEAEREYVMVHESTHIRHGDWLKKLLGIAILAVHWFNPLVWVAFTLFEQDIEMSCDETTISTLDADLRKAYAISIVSYAKASNNSNKKYMVTPLGFSKNAFCKAEVTKRVMNIVNFKKGTKVTTIAILAVVLVLAAACAFNSKSGSGKIPVSKESANLEEKPETSEDTTEDTAEAATEDTMATEQTTISKLASNDHKFVNGVCTDCGKVWNEYYYETLSKLDTQGPSEWKSIYGPESDTMLYPGDYVQFVGHSKDAGYILYHCLDQRPVSESLTLDFSKSGKKPSISFNYTYSMGEYSVDVGIVDYKFTYWIGIDAEAGEFEKIFESKESFAKNCRFYLFVKDKGSTSGSDVWSSMEESDIRKLFEGQKDCTFYTKDEMIDMFWSHYDRMLQSMDNALVVMDTSLADAGFNWKKKSEG